jgi:hypothetical protein
MMNMINDVSDVSSSCNAPFLPRIPSRQPRWHHSLRSCVIVNPC